MTLDGRFLGHARNIKHKLRIAKPGQQRASIERVERLYAELVGRLTWSSANGLGWLGDAVLELDEYTAAIKTLEKTDAFFGWRGDFASSLLPEFLYRIVDERLSSQGIDALYSTRDSIVDITVSGYREGGWSVRRKNQDLCVGLRRDSVETGKGPLSFVVPVVAVEAKTNIDVNKLNGLDFSADRLKRTFPASRYYLVTETLDFSLDRNYAGSIDEIYVLRKQMRSVARRSRGPYHPDVFEAFADDVVSQVQRADVSRTHVYHRLESGRLINV